MKGILLVSHSTICYGAKESCEMIVGKQENIETMSLTEEGVEIFREKLENLLENMFTKYLEVIILTDIPNATPFNECYRYKLSHKERNITILSGMNLAMLIELAMFSSLDMDTEDMAAQVVETGKNSILKL